MRIDSFLGNLKAKDIFVFVENGKVKYDAPTQFVTDDFLADLKARKDEILEYLTNAEQSKEVESETLETSWFDCCAACKSLLYEFGDQWFCSRNCR